MSNSDELLSKLDQIIELLENLPVRQDAIPIDYADMYVWEPPLPAGPPPGWPEITTPHPDALPYCSCGESTVGCPIHASVCCGAGA